jgi:hypothetical protein
VDVDSTKTKESITVRFTLQNLGKRVAKVLRSRLIAWNEPNAIFRFAETLGESDLNPDRTSSAQTNIMVDKKIFKDSTTMYYSKIFYTDIDEKKIITRNKYFRWKINRQNQFVEESILPNDTVRFYNMIMLAKITEPGILK